MKHLILYLVALPCVAFSQHNVSGVVCDQSLSPLQYVKILLFNGDSTITQMQLTDQNGKFYIENIKQDTYTFVIQYFAENLYTQEIILNSHISLDTILVTPTVQLDKITITADKPAIKKELGKYVVDHIASSIFSKGKSTLEFLRFVPILDIDPAGTDIKILNKGSATIHINGKNVGDSETALNMIKAIPASNIERIEIIRTPGSQYSASSQNGVINIILARKKNEGLKGSISTRISQAYFNSQALNSYLSYAKSKLFITSGISLGNNKYFNRSLYTYDNFLNNNQSSIRSSTSSRYQYASAYLNLNYALKKNQSLGIQWSTRFSDREANTSTSNIYQNRLSSQTADSVASSQINTNTPRFLYMRGNLNYHLILDDLGSKVDIDVFFVHKDDDQSSFNRFNFADNSISNFLQNPDIQTTTALGKLAFIKNFNNDDILQLGTSYSQSHINNDFFFGNFDGLNYISDPLQSNNFSYDDYTLAAYITYEKIISDQWEGSIGLRIEHFDAEGKTASQENPVNIQNTYLFPSLSLYFFPHDNHEFSLDLGSHIYRTPYHNLNPFISYHSPNSYRINNPRLLPTRSFELLFNYTFFGDFMLDIEYDRDIDLFSEFDVVLENDFIESVTVNYGSANSLFIAFIYARNFFKGNWDFSTSLTYAYDEVEGSFDDLDLGYENHQVFFKLKNRFNLTKRKDFFLMCNYGFSGTSQNIMGNRNALHSLEIELSKSFKNFNISIGAYDLARANLRLDEMRATYGFNKNIDYFRNYYMTIRYSFGNKKVRKINNKDTKELNDRLL